MTILTGMRVTECGAFIAGPSATLSLAKLGATVIRIDPLQGGIDFHRWPVTDSGASLYWAGLNQGKKSVTIDIRRAEGQELAQAIIAAPGDEAGIFVTNFPAAGWLSFDVLRRRRSDLIMANIVGNWDGSTAVDYTVNCSMGFPAITGEVNSEMPVNHVFPAWDLLCGQTVATGLLAAERLRRRLGCGQFLRIALSDIALAAVADLGFISDVEINGTKRERIGNEIYGAFGRDFRTRDDRRVMIAAISPSQWKALCKATGTEDYFAMVERQRHCDLSREADRFQARALIAARLEPWFSERELAVIRKILDQHRVCWGTYQTFEELVNDDTRCSERNPLFRTISQPQIGSTLTARSAIEFAGVAPTPPRCAPILGQDTEEVLQEVLGLTGSQVGELRGKKLIN